jgi:hypothetical protein
LGRQGSDRTSQVEHLYQAIQQAASQYFQLVILASLPASAKTAALQSVAQKDGITRIANRLD